MDDATFKWHIDQFALEINLGRVGLVHVQVEDQSEPLACYQNVKNKVTKSGGTPVYGWTFLSKRSDKGFYLIAQHHSVWGRPDGIPLDITPYLDCHHPLMIKESVLFLLDQNSSPVVVNGKFVPTPSKFYAITQSTEMAAYMLELGAKELAECAEIYKKVGEEF